MRISAAKLAVSHIQKELAFDGPDSSREAPVQGFFFDSRHDCVYLHLQPAIYSTNLIVSIELIKLIQSTVTAMAISKAKRRAIYEASSGRCFYCGCTLTMEEMTLDHIHAQSVFPEDEYADDVDNLVCCCRRCNNAKAAMSVKEFRKFVNTRNAELLKLEAERRRALARADRLTQEIESRRFAYIRHLRDNEDNTLISLENRK